MVVRFSVDSGTKDGGWWRSKIKTLTAVNGEYKHFVGCDQLYFITYLAVSVYTQVEMATVYPIS